MVRPGRGGGSGNISEAAGPPARRHRLPAATTSRQCYAASEHTLPHCGGGIVHLRGGFGVRMATHADDLEQEAPIVGGAGRAILRIC